MTVPLVNTVDKESINDTITIISRQIQEIKDTQPASTPTPSSGKYIWNKLIEIPCKAVTTAGTVTLDGKNRDYNLLAVIENTSGSPCAYSLYVENDVTATNYQSQRVGAASANDARLLFDTVSSGNRVIIRGTLMLTPNGYFSYIGMAQRIGDNTNDSHSIYKIAAIQNLTRVDVIASVTDGIGVKSLFRIW